MLSELIKEVENVIEEVQQEQASCITPPSCQLFGEPYSTFVSEISQDLGSVIPFSPNVLSFNEVDTITLNDSVSSPLTKAYTFDQTYLILIYVDYYSHNNACGEVIYIKGSDGNEYYTFNCVSHKVYLPMVENQITIEYERAIATNFSATIKIWTVKPVNLTS